MSDQTELQSLRRRLAELSEEWGQLRSRSFSPTLAAVASDRVMSGWSMGAPYMAAGSWVWPMSRPWAKLPDGDEDIPFGTEEIDMRGCQVHSP